MLKFWTFVCICIALFANVAVTDDINSFEDVFVDLITNLPKHFKDAIDETENVDASNALNITGKIRFPHLPRPSQCLKDYLRLHTALLRKGSRNWALEGTVFF